MESGEVKQPGNYCIACRKNFKNEKAYDNHINSKNSCNKQTANMTSEKTAQLKLLENVTMCTYRLPNYQTKPEQSKN